MKHEVIINQRPEDLCPASQLQPFYIVHQERMSLMTDGILVPTSVGIRYCGYFACSGADTPKVAAEALKYGLQTARHRLSSLMEIDFQPLFTERKEEFLQAANEALLESESPCQLMEVVFGYVDYYIPEHKSESAAPQYSGFIMGQSGMRQVDVHAPKGIPGEWQCVCGEYNAPGDCCETCGIRRPIFE